MTQGCARELLARPIWDFLDAMGPKNAKKIILTRKVYKRSQGLTLLVLAVAYCYKT